MAKKINLWKNGDEHFVVIVAVVVATMTFRICWFQIKESIIYFPAHKLRYSEYDCNSLYCIIKCLLISLAEDIIVSL